MSSLWAKWQISHDSLDRNAEGVLGVSKPGSAARQDQQSGRDQQKRGRLRDDLRNVQENVSPARCAHIRRGIEARVGV